MDIGAIFFILAVLTLVGMYLGQPFIQPRGRRATKEDHTQSTRLAEYDRVVSALQELEFDNLLAKVPAEDYPRQRAALLNKGVALLRELDEASSANGKNEPAGADVQKRVEQAVAIRRSDASNRKLAVELSEEELEAQIAGRRKLRKEKSSGFCPKCGKPILNSDRFCPACGKAVN